MLFRSIEELGGTIGRTACERSNSQDPGESAQDADMEVQHPESEAEQQPWGKAAPSDLAMQPASLKGLGADASLLDKVAAEMFAALEGAFGGAESDDSDSEEGSRSSSGDEGEEDGVSAGEDHVEQMQEQVQEETGREAATAAVPGGDVVALYCQQWSNYGLNAVWVDIASFMFLHHTGFAFDEVLDSAVSASSCQPNRSPRPCSFWVVCRNGLSRTKTIHCVGFAFFAVQGVGLMMFRGTSAGSLS